MNALIAWLGGDMAVGRAVAVGILVAARIAPLTLIAPWLALRSTPTFLRAAITVVLATALTPVALPAASEISPQLLWLSVYALREAMVGMVFAVAAALPFLALAWAGHFTDLWRGSALAEVMSPSGQQETTPMGALYLLTGVVLFVSQGGHLIAISAFGDTLVAIPIGASVEPAALETVALQSTRLFASAFAFAAALAIPVAATLVLTDLTLGVLGRAAPQIPLYFAALPLRAALGLAVALFSMSLFIPALAKFLGNGVQKAATLLELLAH